LLDFSRALTGNLFFAPSATFLDAVGEGNGTPDASSGQFTAPDAVKSTVSNNDGSLGIGSLKGDPRYE
jgi:porphyrinogen peroxidase